MRILLQQLIKMSFWNINILFRTKTFSSQLRVFGVGILKCETIDPWQAPEPESEANTVLWQELTQKRCEECMQCSKCGADYEYKGLNIRIKMKCAFDTNWQQMLILDRRNIFIVECCNDWINIFDLCQFLKLVKSG